MDSTSVKYAPKLYSEHNCVFVHCNTIFFELFPEFFEDLF